MSRGKKHSIDTIAEIRRLRQEERLSYQEIHDRTGVAQGTLSSLLSDIPLTKEEQAAKHPIKGRPRQRKTFGETCKYMEWIDGAELSPQQKGMLAEAAVLFRLTLFGFVVFGSVFDGSKEDWIVGLPGKTKVARIQVKCTRYAKWGLPFISLWCQNGHAAYRRYSPGEFDFIIGYDLRSDTAFVFSEVDADQNVTTISMTETAAEQWDCIRNFIKNGGAGGT